MKRTKRSRPSCFLGGEPRSRRTCLFCDEALDDLPLLASRLRERNAEVERLKDVAEYLREALTTIAEGKIGSHLSVTTQIALAERHYARDVLDSIDFSDAPTSPTEDRDHD